MKCEEIKQKIMDFVEGNLQKEQYLIIQNHLKECNSCEKEFEWITGIISSAKKIQIPEYDQSFWDSRYEMIVSKAQQRYRQEIFVRRMKIAFGFLGIFLMLFASKSYLQKNKPTIFINVPEVAYHIPDEVLSEKTFLLPVDEMKKIFDFLEPEDQMTVFAEYLH